MSPTKPKKEYKYEPPKWIDQKFIEALPKEKQIYWANRIQGIPGQGKAPKTAKVISTPEGVTVSFDNDGQMVAKTRALRRFKTPSENKYTKATHMIKKAQKDWNGKQTKNN